MTVLLRFTGSVVTGLGLGAKELRVPTINVRTEDVPDALVHGIYAGKALVDGAWFAAAIHYGPRPVFDAPESFEVHVLDHEVSVRPATVEVEILQKLRDVQDFKSSEDLRIAILEDIRRTKEIAV